MGGMDNPKTPADFQKLVSDLLNSGLTQTELAKKVPCAQATIAAYKSGARGKMPSMEIGNGLMALHKARCKPNRPKKSQEQPSGRHEAKEEET